MGKAEKAGKATARILAAVIAVGFIVVGIFLVLDDATGIGVIDDPIALGLFGGGFLLLTYAVRGTKTKGSKR